MLSRSKFLIVISTLLLTATSANCQWFGRITKVLKEVELSRCFLLTELSEDHVQRLSTGSEYDTIEGNYPYQERSEHVIFFTDSSERDVQEKKYSRISNQIEKLSISEKIGNEATVKSRLQNFIKLKKAFACKEVEP